MNKLRFYFFHLMPYPHIPPSTEFASSWVSLSNKHYDPQRGRLLYNEYIEQLVGIPDGLECAPGKNHLPESKERVLDGREHPGKRRHLRIWIWLVRGVHGHSFLLVLRLRCRTASIEAAHEVNGPPSNTPSGCSAALAPPES